MTIYPWFNKAEEHMRVCEIYFEINDYSYIVHSCFLAMFSVIKALLTLKNAKSKSHEGLIYLFKIYYVDRGLFDRELFRFYCKTKELNTEFFRFNFNYFDEEMAHEVFNRTRIFMDYSQELCDNYL